MRMLTKFVRNESGTTAIEYALIAAFVSIVIVTAVTLVGQDLQNVFNTVAGGLAGA